MKTRMQSMTILTFWMLVAAQPIAAASARAAEPLAEQAPQQVLVVNTQEASVSLVDLATMTELKRFPVGPRPYGVVVLQDGRTFAVGVEDEEKVKFFSLPDFELKGEVHIGKMFNDHILLSTDGRQLLVADFHSDKVFAIDAVTMKDTTPIEGCSAPHVVKYGPSRKNAYVTCKKITGIAIIDPLDKKLLKFHQLNVNPRSLTFSPDESKLYFGSFWVNGFFEMDTETGKVLRLFAFDPPADNNAPQEVTYHGVEAIGPKIVLAANEGRSYVDSVDVTAGKLLDRLTDVAKPCCIERIPGALGDSTRVLVSNIGNGTLQLVEVSPAGKLKTLGKAQVGKAPKRVAFLPAAAAAPAADESKTVWNFDDDGAGKPAKGFKTEMGEWTVTEVDVGKVLSQQAKSPNSTFNLVLVSGTSAKGVDLTVKMKAIDGKIDQGGGLVWRAQDKNNYYLARYNPLEDNYRLYKVQNGKRTLLKNADIKAEPGWRTLRVTMKGAHIECFLDEKKRLAADDTTFPQQGKIGLWSKADAQSYFDDLTLVK